MKKINLLLLFCLAFALVISACKKDDDGPIDDPMDDPITNPMDTVTNPMDTIPTDTVVVNPNATVWNFTVDDYSYDAVQEALILMDEEDTLKFGAGTFEFNRTLSLDDKDQVVIMGAGMDETILDFSNQQDIPGTGAEGVKITANNTIIAKLTVQNTIGDAIKVKDSEHFTFYEVAVTWTNGPDANNGAYGLYPVSSKHVLIDKCRAYAASDAGLYVGQCEHVIVRNSIAEKNVAGIEIENTKYADVYDNVATENTGGILVFDLPELPAGQGESCRIFNNELINNNYENFAEEGNFVAQVPPGTGIMLMASKNVEVFDNTITNNNVMGIGIINFAVLIVLAGETHDDENYVSYPRGINIHDNTFSRTEVCPDPLNAMGGFVVDIFGGDCSNIADIFHDGLPGGEEVGEEVCVKDNAGGTFAKLDIFGETVSWDEPSFECNGITLEPVEIQAPTLE